MGDLLILPETFTLDGTQTTVTVAQPIGFLPTITLDAVAQDVFRSGIDASGQEGWYWSIGRQNVQWQGAIAPTAGSILLITYSPQSSRQLTASTPTAITPTPQRSGKYEIVIPVRGAGDSAEALSRISAMLRKTGDIVPTINFKTWTRGWFPGQVFTVTEPRFNLSGVRFLVQSVSCAPKTNGQMVDLSNRGYGSCLERTIEATQLVPATTQVPAGTQPDGSAGDPIRPTSLITGLGGGGGGGTVADPVVQFDRAVFILGPGGDLAGGTSITNPDQIITSGILYYATAVAGTAPIGQTLVIDVKMNGKSIFKKDTLLKILPGESGTIKRVLLFYQDVLSSPAYLSPVYKDAILTADASYSTSETSGLVAARNVTVKVGWYFTS